MIEKDQFKKENYLTEGANQDHEKEVFESVSQQSQQDQQSSKLQNQDYSLTTITFPPPQPNTLRLLTIYQKNTELISKIKSQIQKLSKIKRENLFIKNDCVKSNFQQENSEFFLKSLELFNERQLELKKITNQIKYIDQQQLTTLMSKNQNILNLAQIYFSKFRTIIDAKIYGQQLILLTEEKKKVHHKKKKHQQQADFHNHQHLRQQIKKSQQKIINSQQKIRKDEEHSESESKISTPRKREQQKFNTLKRMFNIRFLHLSQLFPQMEQKNKERQYCCFSIGISNQSLPRSFVYDNENKLIFVLFSSNTIKGYLKQTDSQEHIKEEHSQSHKSECFRFQKLREINGFEIEIDRNVEILLFQLKDNLIFVLTSDGVLRVYEMDFDFLGKTLTYDIKNIVYCMKSEEDFGQIQHAALNKNNVDQIFIITDKKKLCKVNLNKYETQIVKVFHQEVLDMNEDLIRTQNSIYLRYFQSNFLPIAKNKIEKILDEQDDHKQRLKICSVVIKDNIFFTLIGKHGHVTGFSHQF